MNKKIFLASFVLVALLVFSSALALAQNGAYHNVAKTITFSTKVLPQPVEQPLLYTENIPIQPVTIPGEPQYFNIRIQNVDPNYDINAMLRIKVTANGFMKDDNAIVMNCWWSDPSSKIYPINLGAVADYTLRMADFEFIAGIGFDKILYFDLTLAPTGLTYTFEFETIGFAIEAA